MALAYEGNTDLAFDTNILRQCASKYGEIAESLRTMSSKLNGCLTELSESGWTTQAGKTFQKLAEVNWEENIEKYAGLLDTLNDILTQASQSYDDLVVNHIEKTTL